MSELAEFREETRAWLEANVPAALRGKAGDPEALTMGGKRAVYKYPETKEWMEVAAEKGWTIPHWPEQYGGGGHSKEESQIIAQEIAFLWLDGRNGDVMAKMRPELPALRIDEPELPPWW